MPHSYISPTTRLECHTHTSICSSKPLHGSVFPLALISVWYLYLTSLAICGPAVDWVGVCLVHCSIPRAWRGSSQAQRQLPDVLVQHKSGRAALLWLISPGSPAVSSSNIKLISGCRKQKLGTVPWPPGAILLVSGTAHLYRGSCLRLFHREQSPWGLCPHLQDLQMATVPQSRKEGRGCQLPWPSPSWCPPAD